MTEDTPPLAGQGPALHLGGLWRRALQAGLYALLTVLLARAIAAEVGAVATALQGVGGILPSALQELGPEPTTLALAALGVVAAMLAAGTFLVSRDTGSAFALLAIGTAAWFLFPYSEVPWTTVITGADQTRLSPPLSAWLIAGLLTVQATGEVLASSRETLLARLGDRQLPEPMLEAAAGRSLAATLALLGGALLAGGLITLAYALFRQPLSRGLIPEPDLVWVPAILGLVAGLLLYLASRR